MQNFENDLLYEDLDDVINKEINPVTGRDFRSWYMGCFYRLGRDEVLKIASIARADGKDKKRYFSLLLKQAVAKAQANKQSM